MPVQRLDEISSTPFAGRRSALVEGLWAAPHAADSLRPVSRPDERLQLLRQPVAHPRVYLPRDRNTDKAARTRSLRPLG